MAGKGYTWNGDPDVDPEGEWPYWVTPEDMNRLKPALPSTLERVCGYVHYKLEGATGRQAARRINASAGSASNYNSWWVLMVKKYDLADLTPYWRVVYWQQLATQRGRTFSPTIQPRRYKDE
jgi:hypothetical protein